MPVIPLVDVVDRAGAVLFWQSGPICVNAGVTFGVTVMDSVVIVAHCPAVGVNVYVVVAVLFKVGAQVPVMPLVEVVGNGVNVAPEHIDATGLKVGVTFGVTVMVSVVVVAHCPAVGVNV